tara:strand:+ start:3569 stop:5230 length:1662 start_codon:yes stop_codon:yes gene_type:complete
MSQLRQQDKASKNGMVVTHHKEATDVGVDVLISGGNAIDAAIASCLAVGVVQPASSGIGGGGYLVYEMSGKGGVIGFPMRGSGSVNTDSYKLVDEKGGVGGFQWHGVQNNDNLEGYKSIAIPGAISGLFLSHQMFGTIPMKELMAPAIKLARDGFYPEWYDLYAIGLYSGKFTRYSELAKTFLPDGEMPKSGILFKQPDLADTLEHISRNGADEFYKGDIAKSIINEIQQDGGFLNSKDMSSYQSFNWDKGLEIKYSDNVVRVPPFASGGLTTAMTLKFYEAIRKTKSFSGKLNSYISAAKMAYLDRFEYVGDPDFVDVPWDGMISDKYIFERARDASVNYEDSKSGNPWKYDGKQKGESIPGSYPSFDSGTTHLCVYDKFSNAVSLTNTLMGGFGSGIIPKSTGVIMNNGMMWFDPLPGRVNSVMPGKFPLNNMSPGLVLDKKGVKLALGAAGGRKITNCVSQLIIKMLDSDISAQEAVDSPRVDCSNPKTLLDSRYDESLVKELSLIGNEFDFSDGVFAHNFSTPAAIKRMPDGNLTGGVHSFGRGFVRGV